MTMPILAVSLALWTLIIAAVIAAIDTWKII
jgi:hypothetical protein